MGYWVKDSTDETRAHIATRSLPVSLRSAERLPKIDRYGWSCSVDDTSTYFLRFLPCSPVRKV